MPFSSPTKTRRPRSPQKVTLKLSKAFTVKLFDRKTSEWKVLEVKDGAVSFDLGKAAGELLRFEK